jgi:mannan endo-1,6-alpha-mannosidase
MFGCMIDYWKLTGDTQYNDMITQALLFQVGPHNDYAPPNQTLSLGNDDQAFWAMAALTAAETNFPNPSGPNDPSWLALAQAVFNEQIGRWDTKTCGGGLHWQIPLSNGGYHLKNSISNGCLFQIAARLARYTGDPDNLYSSWPEKIWQWMESVDLIDDAWNVYDNTDENTNCTVVDRHQWIYNAATMMVGCATMWNITSDPIWQNRTQGLLNTFAFDYFQVGGIMQDICELYNACNPDEKSFKAYTSRWMATTAQLAPFTFEKIHDLLITSAVAAAQQCSGGADGTTCGLKWFMNATWDGTDGVGQQMDAMEVFLSTLIQEQPAPLTNATGGTSISDPTAGFNASDTSGFINTAPVTKGEKAGAWFLTVVLILVTIMGLWFLNSNAFEGRGGGLEIMDRRRTKMLSKTKRAPPEGEVLYLSRGSVGVLPKIIEKPTPIHQAYAADIEV